MKNIMEKKWLYVVILVVVFFAGVCVGVLGAGGDDHGTNRLSYNSGTSDNNHNHPSKGWFALGL